jgi:hypothetical protein
MIRPSSGIPDTVARLFISQERIDRWLAEERVTIDGDRMLLPAFGTMFFLRPAVLFRREVGGGDDPMRLIGRVKSEEQVREIGGELQASSVVVGDSAYECETGFLAEVLSSRGPGSPSSLSSGQIEQLQG